MPLTNEERQDAIRYAEIAADVCRQGAAQGGLIAHAVLAGCEAAFRTTGFHLVASEAARVAAFPHRPRSHRGDAVALLHQTATAFERAAAEIRGGAEPVNDDVLEEDRAAVARVAAAHSENADGGVKGIP